VALAYISNIFKLHGLPAVIVSDHDKVFTSTLWKELFRLLHTQLKMSSAYHPQTDGQTECVNQCLETYLRCFAHSCPTKWMSWLHLAEFWYNTSPHATLGTSPFEVLYGHSPRHFGVIDPADCAVADLSEWLQDRQDTMALLQQHLQRAREHMKATTDKKRTDRVFAVGDWVYLKLQPYMQRTLATRSNPKLAFRYFGPFQVLQRVGATSYKLDLPESCKIHPVIHVSQLRQAVPPSTEVHAELPAPAATVPEPVAVLETRLYQHGRASRPQVLIQWLGQPASLATWEDQAELLHRFPDAPAWGQAGSRPPGSVTVHDRPASSAKATSAVGLEPTAQVEMGRGKRVKWPNPRYLSSPSPASAEATGIRDRVPPSEQATKN
jgi:hypothetical protein